MFLFSKNPGSVFRYDGEATPIRISIEGFNTSIRCALLSLGVGGAANVSITNSMKKTIYIYTMGEKSGKLQLSGVVFPPPVCVTDAVGPVDPSSGFELLRNYYQKYNVSSRGQPVDVTIGQTVLEGFLMAWECNIAQPESGVGAFSLVMMTPPEN